jgi:hypothetical protein
MFEIDSKGFARLAEARGKFAILAELIGNAWDSYDEPYPQDAKVEFTLTHEGEGKAFLAVEDWGGGFTDISEAYTLYAPSRRADKYNKIGRFNIGEKSALSQMICPEIISTTPAGVRWDEDRQRHSLRQNRPKGTLVRGRIRISQADFHDLCEKILTLIPPLPTVFNGKELTRPPLITTFQCKLPTVIAEDGVLKDRVRQGTVQVYAGYGAGKGEILEMGIPVVETDNDYICNVLQKVPLGTERDNVPPKFLRALNAALLNAIADKLTEEEASKPWVTEAAGNPNITKEALKDVLGKRFGERALVVTPGDPLANTTATLNGHTLVGGGSMSGDMWDNVKKHDLLKPTVAVYPSPKIDQLVERPVCSKCGRPV